MNRLAGVRSFGALLLLLGASVACAPPAVKAPSPLLEAFSAGARAAVEAPAETAPAGALASPRIQAPRGGLLGIEGSRLQVRVEGLGAATTLEGIGPARRFGEGWAFYRPRGEALEELFLVPAPAEGEAVARWTVEGGRFIREGGAVLLRDDAGRPVARVSAPWAELEGGQRLRPRLLAQGAQLSLFVDGARAGAWVLVDPIWIASAGSGLSRSDHTATLLPTGEIVLAGGFDAVGFSASVEIFDPVAVVWTPVAGLATARSSHTASLLHDGRLLVVGGRNGAGALGACEASLDQGRTFGACQALATPRFSHTATVLRDGRLLITGGYDAAGAPLSSAEIFDPATGAWSDAGVMVAARAEHAAVLLPGDEVLLTGGVGAAGEQATAERWGTGVFTATGSMSLARARHTATLLYDGRVLLVGGEVAATPLAGADLYDLTTGLFTPTLGVPAARAGHSASLLPDGQVVLAGGQGAAGLSAIAQIYDPSADAFVTGGILSTPRDGHTATVLPDARLAILAGSAGATPLGDSERFRQGVAGWTPTGSLSVPRKGFGLARLGDGRVMAVAGKNDAGDLDSAEIYDPVSGAWIGAGILSGVRVDPQVVVLGNEVIVAGGDDGTDSVATVERWSAGSWTGLPSMNDRRLDLVLVLLSDGGIFAVAGEDTLNLAAPELDTTEVFYPGAAAWSPRARLATARRRARGLTLPDGRVLVAGGKDAGGGPIASAEIYDPAGNAWSAAGLMSDVRVDFSMTLLPSGKVLVAGGKDAGGLALSSCDLFDPTTGSWTPSGALGTARLGHMAALLPDGRVLVVGGEDGATPRTTFDTTEIWDPGSGTWSPAQTAGGLRRQGHATRLGDGRILVVAGKDNDPTTPVIATAELYDLGSGGPAIWVPTLAAPLPSFPGAQITLSGGGFTGGSEASGGRASASSVAFPLLQLRDRVGGAPSFLELVRWTDSSLEARLPGTLSTGLHDLTVVVAGSPSTSVPLQIDPPPPGPQRVTFLSPPQTLATGTCSAPATFELQDAAGVALPNLVSATGVALSSVPPGITFFSDASCTSPITSVTVPAGQTLGTFYFIGTVVGPSNLFAAAPGLSTGFLSATFSSGPVGQLAFLTPPRAPRAGICSGPVTVETRDEFGTLKVVSASTPLTLAASLGGVAFFSDATCQSPVGNVRSVLAGASQASFYFSGTIPGTGALQVQATGYQSASQTFDVLAGALASLVVETPVVQTTAGSCAGPVTVALRDAVGNPTLAAADLTLDLSASPSSTLRFSLDAACASPTTSATIATGQGSVDLYFQDTVAGAPTLRFRDASGAIAFVEQTESVLAGAPAALAFAVQPTTVAVAAPIAPAVEVETVDTFGNRAPSPASTITLSVGANPGGATLSGSSSVSTSAGLARFADLGLDRAGQGYTLIATAPGLVQAESAPFDVSSTSTALDPGSPVSASGSSAEACAGQGVWITLIVEPRATDGSALAPGRTITITEDPPYLVQGAVTELAGAAPRYEIEVGSNRCGGARAVQVRVDGAPLSTEPSLTFTCPPVQSSGMTSAADPAQVPADGLTPAVVTVTVLDRCGNPAFGRAVSLDLTNAALSGASVSPASVRSADTPGSPGDGSARFEIVSIDAGSTGVAAHVEGVTAVSAGDLVTFALDDVLGVTLGSSKTSVVVGESLDLILRLESAYAGRLGELVITPTLGRLKVLKVIGAEEVADGTLRIPSLNPRSTTEVILTVQAQAGSGNGTARASVAYGIASGGDRKTASSTTLEISIQSQAATGCECGSTRDAPRALVPLMALFLGLLSTRRRRQK